MLTKGSPTRAEPPGAGTTRVGQDRSPVRALVVADDVVRCSGLASLLRRADRVDVVGEVCE